VKNAELSETPNENEEENNLCDEMTCQNNGACLDHIIERYICLCNQPFYGNKCQFKDFCFENPCATDQICHQYLNKNYTCEPRRKQSEIKTSMRKNGYLKKKQRNIFYFFLKILLFLMGFSLELCFFLIVFQVILQEIKAKKLILINSCIKIQIHAHRIHVKVRKSACSQTKAA
jgi:hypothetical protein